MEKIGIYIHIPFCKSKCKYCNFTSFCNKNDYMEDYFKALVKEIQNFHNTFQFTEKRKVDTIYIGGGTPSTFFLGGIATILDTIRNNFDVEDNAEISIEANPNSVDYQKIQEWKNAGVTRVSVGLQSIKQTLLKRIGRTHTKDDFIKTIHILQAVGLTNINADIMIGLPTQKLRDVRKTLNAIKKLSLKHISCYSLILEENTPLYNEVQQGLVKEPTEEKTIAMYDYVVQELRKWGMDRYEVSNFSYPKFECKHNINCWQMHEYAGFGTASHGYINHKRYQNVNTIEGYIKKMADDNNAIEFSEEIDNKEEMEEYIMLGLRTKKGISITKLKEKYHYDLLNKKKEKIAYFSDNQLIEIKNDAIYATDEGFHVLNQIILEFVD